MEQPLANVRARGRCLTQDAAVAAITSEAKPPCWTVATCAARLKLLDEAGWASVWRRRANAIMRRANRCSMRFLLNSSGHSATLSAVVENFYVGICETWASMPCSRKSTAPNTQHANADRDYDMVMNSYAAFSGHGPWAGTSAMGQRQLAIRCSTLRGLPVRCVDAILT